MKKLIATLLLLAALPLLGACNTTAGAGQDIQAGGKAIEKSAVKNMPQ
jgi:predicted small secreted protein